MRVLHLAAVLAPSALAFTPSPQLVQLLTSIGIAIVVYFTGGVPRKRKSHRDDFDAN